MNTYDDGQVGLGCRCGFGVQDRGGAYRRNDMALHGHAPSAAGMAERRAEVSRCLDGAALGGGMVSLSARIGSWLLDEAAGPDGRGLVGPMAAAAVDELRRRVEGSELVGPAWTRVDDETRAKAEMVLGLRFAQWIATDVKAVGVAPVRRTLDLRYSERRCLVPGDFDEAYSRYVAMFGDDEADGYAELPMLEGPAEWLSDDQIAAVEATEGPVLVDAGPGSGKTRVIVERIVHLVQVMDVHPSEIVALVFNRHAAEEIRHRLRDEMGPERAKGVRVRTFNRFAMDLVGDHMERHGQLTAWERRGCGVCDGGTSWAMQSDSEHEKWVGEALGGGCSDNAVNTAGQVISLAKTALVSSELYRRIRGTHREDRFARIYGDYEARCRSERKLDHDGWLVKAYDLLRGDEGEVDGQQFRYVLADEFQDVSPVQYGLLLQLSQRYGNLTCVGDGDQLIGEWRNSDRRMMLGFMDYHVGARQFSLDRNYRSDGRIVDLARTVIGENADRLEKYVWTGNPDGVNPVIAEGRDQYDEALIAAGVITRNVAENGVSFGDCVVAYRNNFQDQTLKDVFGKHGIPFRQHGGDDIYGRKEVRGALAVLRVLHDVSDDASMRRMVLAMARGVGKATVDKAMEAVSESGGSLFEALDAVGGRTRKSVGRFRRVVLSLVEAKGGLTLVELFDRAMKETGYRDSLEPERRSGLSVLRYSMRPFEGKGPDGLAAFLSWVHGELGEGDAVVDLDVETVSKDEANHVLLSTLHKLKGLEFKVVVLVGVEDGLLPRGKELDGDGEEEERRLLYVGMTRAIERLYVLRATHRDYWGAGGPSLPSRFVGRVDGAQVEYADGGPWVPSAGDVERAEVLAERLRSGGPVVDEVGVVEIGVGDLVEHTRIRVSGVVRELKDVGAVRNVVVDFEPGGRRELALESAPLRVLRKAA